MPLPQIPPESDRGFGQVITPADTPFVKLMAQGNDLSVVPNFLKSFTFEHNFGEDGASQATIQLFDPNFDQLENVIFSSSLAISFQWGWANGTKSNLHEAIIASYDVAFEWGQGTLLTLTTTDITQQFLNNTTDNTSWKASDKPSEIAQFFATKHNLTPIVEESYPLNVPLTQPVGLSDLAFLQTIKKLAISARTGIGGYVFSVTANNELHFHTRNYVQDEAKKFIYYLGRERNGVIMEFSPVVESQTQLAFGGSGFQVQCYDPVNKKDIVYTANNETLVGMPSTGQKVPKDAATPRVARVPYFAFQNAQAVAQDRFIAHSSGNYDATIKMYGNPTIRPGDIIDIEVLIPKSGPLPERLHYTSGPYFVQSATHEIDDGGSYTTTCKAQRQGSSMDDLPNGGSSFNTTTPPQEPSVLPQDGNAQPATRQKTAASKQELINQANDLFKQGKTQEALSTLRQAANSGN
jgi:hypothetical protein